MIWEGLRDCGEKGDGVFVWGPAGWLVLLEDIKAITFFEL